jgi:hypothetical protein
MRIFFVLALGFFFLWASDLRIEKGAREPRAGDILDIGDPLVYARSQDGALIAVENDEKVRKFIERLTLDDQGRQIDPLILATGSASDLIRIREAVLDFFTQARMRASMPASG